VRSSRRFAKERGCCGDSGRLEDYLDRRLFHFNALRILILDEADRMLEWDFFSDKEIVSILPKERQTMCFSATMEGDMAAS